MKIDPSSGAIRLPAGFEIDAELTRDTFLATEEGKAATSPAGGNAPWMNYQVSGGSIDGNDLIVGLCFFEELIVSVDLTVSLYPADKRGWEHYSSDVEADCKRLHEQLLALQLGAPANAIDNESMSQREFLTTRVDWDFDWGQASSFHDSNGGGTFIRICYGDRRENTASTG
ncbi:MAG: hypothetical protein AAF456_13190 [Planctomycetota bacterium]